MSKNLQVDINREWFSKYGAIDPDKAGAELEKFIKDHKDQRGSEKYKRLFIKKVLHLVTGYSEQQCFFYITGDWEHINEKKVKHLEYLYEELGLPKPIPDKDQEHKRKLNGKHHTAGLKKTGNKQIALLCDLDINRIPSPRYQLYVISQFVQIGRNYGVALHNVSQAKLEVEISRIAAIFQPHAIVMLRLTPNVKVESLLSKFNLPTILVHADKRKYEFPILANIVPTQNKEEIKADIREWAQKKLKKMNSNSNKIVFASMEKEIGQGSIRNERIDAILTALRELGDFHVVSCEVDNYSFLEAKTIWNRHKDAIAYVVLSDQLAIALEFLVREKNPDAEIIGFDNSNWAQKAKISSFDQSLDKTGQVVLALLNCFHRKNAKSEGLTRILTLQKFGQELVVELPINSGAKACLVELPVKLVLR